jgi:hypothetical protein
MITVLGLHLPLGRAVLGALVSHPQVLALAPSLNEVSMTDHLPPLSDEDTETVC